MPKIRSSAAAAAGAVLLLVLGGLVGKKDHEQQSTPPAAAAAAHLERSERHVPQPVEPAQAPTPGPKRAEWPLWIDEQWKHAPAATRENITAEIARRPCAGGFFERYTTPLDPSIPFEPDEAALRAQFLNSSAGRGGSLRTSDIRCCYQSEKATFSQPVKPKTRNTSRLHKEPHKRPSRRPPGTLQPHSKKSGSQANYNSKKHQRGRKGVVGKK
ncbi:hypothetical protein DIPPA_09119 [Diplonema papillatum]|nr:hypothetical protein DIPPA_09119 [Diplonema papillatum]